MRILGIPLLLIYQKVNLMQFNRHNKCYNSEFDDNSPCSEENHNKEIMYRDNISSINEIDALNKEFIERIETNYENIVASTKIDLESVYEHLVYSRSGIPPWKYIQKDRYKDSPP